MSPILFFIFFFTCIGVGKIFLQINSAAVAFIDILIAAWEGLNIFTSETTGPIEAKFYMNSPWDGRTKVCSNGPGHITKMAACPYMVKTLKIFLSETKRLMTLKLSM